MQTICWERYPLVAKNPHAQHWLEIQSMLGLRPPHLTLYAVGAFKLANVLVNLGIIAYTEQWSALAPAGVLM
jgi:hypothetical protein